MGSPPPPPTPTQTQTPTLTVGEEKLLLSLPVVDFRGLDPNNPTNTDLWQAATSQVVGALETYGCFEAIFDRAGPGLREDLFERAIPELFAVPEERKMKNVSDGYGPYSGYLGRLPGMAYESLRVDSAVTLEGCRAFTSLMWPDQHLNPIPTFFCDTVWTYAKHMQELLEMVQIMFLQSFGLDLENKYSNYCHLDPKCSGLRLSEYSIPSESEQQTTMTGMAAHRDPHMFTIVCQHHVEGLEVQTSNGQWIHVLPLPNSFTIMIGEAFTAWTNGRFRAPYHRVKMNGNEKRYSALFGTRPGDEGMVQPLEELVDSDHPLIYKPFNYIGYLNFRFSEEGRKCENPLEAFCGVGSEVKA